MSRAFSGGKRQREADRDRRKREKEERLRRNRALRAAGVEEPSDVASSSSLPEVSIDDVVIGVPSRPRRGLDRPTKVFVGGLSWDTTVETLRGAFSRFGSVIDVALIPDRNTGRSRGFGFVTFEKDVDAEAAIKEMNGAELDGRTLRVNRAEAR
jgi:RNA recognition motif-containing protein